LQYKRREIELKESRDNLKEQIEECTAEIRKQADLLNLTHDAIFTRDFNDKITFWNRGAEETYGWSQDEALGKIAPDLLQTEFSKPLSEIKATVLMHNWWNGELIHTKRDSTKIIVSSRWSLQKDENDEPMGFIEINIDITERKRADEHFHKELERESVLFGLYNKAPELTDKELYDYALDHAVSLTGSIIGFFHLVSDDQKNIILTTWNSETLKNCTASFENHYPVEMAGNWVDCIHLKRPVIYNDFSNSPNRKGLPEGHTPVKRFMSIPVFDGDKIKFIFGVGNKREEYDDHDVIQIQAVANELYKIIKQRHWEEALKEAHDNLEEQVKERTLELNVLVDELKRSNEELEQFAYVASHDLQEPLRTTASFAQLLKRRYEGKFDENADEFMDYIVDAAKRMQQMITDLLQYSRVMTKGGEFKSTDVEESIGTAILNLKSVIDENKAEITHDPLPTVIADSGQLVKVFQNLISNAIKYRKKDETPKIHVSARKDKGEYVFSVIDNGMGMDPQFTERIFTIFQRLHTGDEYEGTGIGLSIVKRIIERHGGRIWVESELSKGSTFYFTIPFIGIRNESKL
jgi:PAS domain S-box-containing protein